MPIDSSRDVDFAELEQRAGISLRQLPPFLLLWQRRWVRMRVVLRERIDSKAAKSRNQCVLLPLIFSSNQPVKAHPWETLIPFEVPL